MSKILECVFGSKNQYEIGVDECARGPMFGRLYTAAVILPKDTTFHHEKMKDSKKIKSRNVMKELSNYIKENAIAWHIDFVEPEEIDKINIRQAVLKSMRESITNVMNKIESDDVFLVVDGNDFTPYYKKDTLIQHQCVEKGDNTYSFIAAASILAKCAHDEYILEICEQHPELQERYHLKENVGYGTKLHMEGIKTHGITQWHRKTYGICKTAKYSPIE